MYWRPTVKKKKPLTDVNRIKTHTDVKRIKTLADVKRIKTLSEVTYMYRSSTDRNTEVKRIKTLTVIQRIKTHSEFKRIKTHRCQTDKKKTLPEVKWIKTFTEVQQIKKIYRRLTNEFFGSLRQSSEKLCRKGLRNCDCKNAYWSPPD